MVHMIAAAEFKRVLCAAVEAAELPMLMARPDEVTIAIKAPESSWDSRFVQVAAQGACYEIRPRSDSD